MGALVAADGGLRWAQHGCFSFEKTANWKIFVDHVDGRVEAPSDSMLGENHFLQDRSNGQLAASSRKREAAAKKNTGHIACETVQDHRRQHHPDPPP